MNRGWVPYDFKDMKFHYNNAVSGKIFGVLYRGDAQTKYSKPNSPTIDKYEVVNPYDCSLLMQLPNKEEASQFMLY